VGFTLAFHSRKEAFFLVGCMAWCGSCEVGQRSFKLRTLAVGQHSAARAISRRRQDSEEVFDAPMTIA
jgi:hypothetical protein